MTVAFLGQFVTTLNLRRASLWTIPSPPEAGATRRTVSSSGRLMQCLWLTARRSRRAPYALKAEARPPSREHRLAQVPRGTQVALRSETSLARGPPHALKLS